MSQIESGVRSILSYPYIYDLLQNLLGAKKTRTDFVETYIKPKENDNILDIGCGTSEILSFLPPHVNYYGFDQSEAYIEHAKSRFRDQGIFKCAEVNEVEVAKLPKMNIVLATRLIHHLNDRQVETLLTTAKNSLADNGKFIAIDPCYSQDQSFAAKWLIDRDRGNNVRDKVSYETLACNIFTEVRSEVIHRKWIPYTHHILVCSA